MTHHSSVHLRRDSAPRGSARGQAFLPGIDWKDGVDWHWDRINENRTLRC